MENNNLSKFTFKLKKLEDLNFKMSNFIDQDFIYKWKEDEKKLIFVATLCPDNEYYFVYSKRQELEIPKSMFYKVNTVNYNLENAWELLEIL